MNTSRQSMVDALRALALCGIVLMNVEYFSRPLSSTMIGLDPELSGWSYAVAWAVKLLVHGKFWHIFAMLFGASLVWFVQRHPERSMGRRLGLLLGIGAVHGIVIWGGDILSAYAIAGFLTLALLHQSWRSLIGVCLMGAIVSVISGSVWVDWFFVLMLCVAIVSLSGHIPLWVQGLLLWFIPQALSCAMYLWGDLQFLSQYRWDVLAQSQHEASQTLWAGMQWRGQFWMEHNSDGFGILGVLGLMLIGVHLAQANVLKSAKLPSAWIGMGAVGLLVSAACLWLAPTWLEHNTREYLVSRAIFQWSALPMALMYMALAWRAFQSFPSAITWLSPAGRMTLSLYVMQSVVGVVLVWLTPFEAMPLPAQFAVALGLVGAQLLLARWWLAHHHRGPLEYCWEMAQRMKMP